MIRLTNLELTVHMSIHPVESCSQSNQDDLVCSVQVRFANEYWTELSENIQSAAITANIRRMYDGIQKALGPTLNKTAPLRSSIGEVITDKGHELERWVEHFSDIYSRENIVSPSALDAVECLPTMEELDTEPTLRISTRPSTAWPLARPLAATGFPQTY